MEMIGQKGALPVAKRVEAVEKTQDAIKKEARYVQSSVALPLADT